MKARLNFAIAMSFDFDCYIIDELTAVGDQVFREKSRKIFEKKRKNAGFIKVSHNMGELLKECDTGLLLEDANLQIFPTMKEAVDRYKELTSPPKEMKPAQKPPARPEPAAKPTFQKLPRMAPVPHTPAPMMPRQKQA
jgi:ABC-type polysaccharide/polyol phosphate transport system ATPase subunit